jgi:hypothetical protein
VATRHSYTPTTPAGAADTAMLASNRIIPLLIIPVTPPGKRTYALM